MVFMGFKREGRPPGARNDLWVIPADSIAMREACLMADGYHKPYWIDAVEILRSDVSFRDVPAAARGLAMNPNAAGVLIVGFGGDEAFAWSIEKGRDDVRSMILGGDAGDSTETFRSLLDRLAAGAARTRFAFGASDIRVGVADDGRDESRAFALGFCDWLASNGGCPLRPSEANSAGRTGRIKIVAFESLAFLGAQVIAFVGSCDGSPAAFSLAPVVNISVRPVDEPPDPDPAVGMERLFGALLAVAAGETL
jgi:hypothetical protein